MKDKLIWGFLIFLIGVSFGYWWRSVQTEGTWQQEAEVIREMNRETRRDLAYIEGRLMALEGEKHAKTRREK